MPTTEEIRGDIFFRFQKGTDPEGRSEFERLQDIVVVIGGDEFSLADLLGVKAKYTILNKITRERIMAIRAEQEEELRKDAEDSAAERRGGFW